MLNTFSSFNSITLLTSSLFFRTGPGADIPLQCLDVRALLSRVSTPLSSVDLEWEHEALPGRDPSMESWQQLPELDPLPSLWHEVPGNDPSLVDPTPSDWSRVSSADSLEWDPGRRDSPVGSVDTDTRQLLQEIEMLTDLALRETGETLRS